MKLIGTTLNETFSAFRGKRPNKKKDSEKNSEENSRLIAIARIVITILLIGVSITLLMLEKSPDVAKISIGAVIGYWLK